MFNLILDIDCAGAEGLMHRLFNLDSERNVRCLFGKGQRDLDCPVKGFGIQRVAVFVSHAVA